MESQFSPKASNLGMCVFLNIDSVVQIVFGFFVAAGVIRNGKGKWILEYNQFLGKCLVFTTELWAILDGLL